MTDSTNKEILTLVKYTFYPWGVIEEQKGAIEDLKATLESINADGMQARIEALEGDAKKNREAYDALATELKKSQEDCGALEADLDEKRNAYEASETKAKENYALYEQATADMENLRKRSEKEVADARQFALLAFAREVGDVRDCLQQALTVDATENAEVLREGVDMTFRMLNNAMKKQNILPINPDVGSEFDPNLHSAIGTRPASEEVAVETVAKVVQVGYTLNGRVVRPANVFVAVAVEDAPEKTEESAKDADEKAGAADNLADETGESAEDAVEAADNNTKNAETQNDESADENPADDK